MAFRDGTTAQNIKPQNQKNERKKAAPECAKLAKGKTSLEPSLSGVLGGAGPAKM
jgi:hypothetical protein